MQLSVSKLGAMALLGFLVTACTDDGVGDPCIPETIPCSDPDSNGDRKCGFNLQESYIESSSVQCRSRLCIVHKLDNKSNGATPADPRLICDGEDRDNGCVTEAEFSQSIFCTCRCDGPSTSVDFCECPDGFSCEDVLQLGGDGIRGKYCVKPKQEE
jgi:hypothetical protein